MRPMRSKSAVALGVAEDFYSPIPRTAVPDYTPADLHAPLQTATAPALQYLSLVPDPVERPEQTPASLPDRLQYQPSLFRDVNSPKVIPIPTLTPLRESAPESNIARHGPGAARQTPRRNTPAHSQQDFEFHEEVKNLPLEMQVEVIYCDAPVALPAHRIIAAAVDLSMVLVGARTISWSVLSLRRRHGIEPPDHSVSCRSRRESSRCSTASCGAWPTATLPACVSQVCVWWISMAAPRTAIGAACGR